MSRIVDKILREAKLDIEYLFNGHDDHRYAFIWRDVTKYVSIEDKRAIVAKIEKLRNKSGGKLPVVKVNPQQLIATQDSVDSDNIKKVAKNSDQIDEIPFVVKLNGVYYLLDGHHRTSTYLITKENFINVRLLDLDNGNFL